MTRSAIASRRRSGAAGERGSLTIEMIFLFPMMLFILFIGVQAATWYHARSIVLAAAQDGARTAAAEGG
ncbi:TadE/TadG family type IV pilus assembly protein, partial [Kribbia dieselivorans]|uniref:TadE/TadG family type IV pilus assembly protein n=1 Tax=Kribbia dieselivorans TaxID=331526 RepID=UPI0014702807